MQNRQISCPQHVALYVDESVAFNRSLLSIVRQWDKEHNIEIHTSTESGTASCFKPVLPHKTHEDGHIGDEALRIVDQNGVIFQGADAVPIILKYLPFGKLVAAMFILPGTMWITRQLYSLDFTH